ncbi:MAG: hypothetical protein KG003_07940 [Bacteroidetes bacterium]|nr:hypothetical protein [Bacteroidota bacterium]
MKLQSAKNNILLYSILFTTVAVFVSSNSNTDTKWKFTGIWQYRAVTKNDSFFWKVSSTDTMVILNNGKFYYNIESANKHASGNWKPIYIRRKNKSVKGLRFQYSDGKSRAFMFCYLDKDSLCLQEGNLKFLYSRKN